MAKIEDRAPGSTASLNDDIGEEKRLAMYRTQVVIREAEQRAYDLFLQNLVKGTSHLSLGQEAVAAGFAVATGAAACGPVAGEPCCASAIPHPKTPTTANRTSFSILTLPQSFLMTLPATSHPPTYN